MLLSTTVPKELLVDSDTRALQEAMSNITAAIFTHTPDAQSSKTTQKAISNQKQSNANVTLAQVLHAIESLRQETSKMRKEIHKLLEEIVAKDIKIASLESWIDVLQDKVNDLEQKDKNKNVVIFGLRTQTYLSAVRAEADVNVKELESQSAVEENNSVRAFMELTKAMDMKIERQEICNICQLPKKNSKAPNVTAV